MMQLPPWDTFKVFLTHRYILLGLAVRLLISPFFAHSFDMGFLVHVASSYYQGAALFGNWGYPFYFYPILVVFYFPAYLFSDDVFFFGQPFTLLEKFFIKLPSNISDLFIAYVLFLIMKKLGKDRYAIPVALFYWFNPMSLFVSSVWGMFDSVATVFALLSVYHFTEGRRVLSAVELGVGFGVKQHPIVLLPLFIFFLWRERKGETLKFLLAFAVPAAVSVLPSITIQYNTILHIYSLGFFPSNLSFISRSFPADIYHVFDPNMSYRALLYRFSMYFFYVGTSLGTELVPFGILYLLFFLFLWKTRFFDKKLSLEITPLTLCASVVYLIYFLSFPRVSPNYFLWVLPFLLILFATGKIEKIILLLINFMPFAYMFLRGSFFYHINQNYSGYAHSMGLEIAGGFLFSLSCIFVIQSLLKEEILTLRPFRKAYQFIEKIPAQRRNLLFVFSLVSMFLLIVKTMNANGVYWWGYPITFSVSFENITLSIGLQLVILVFIFLTLSPLAVAIAPTLQSVNGNVRRWRWELGILIAALSSFTVITCIILWVTIPYINTSTSFFFGWVPVFGALRSLCENGGIITSSLLSVAGFTGLDLLFRLPKQSPSENKAKTGVMNLDKKVTSH